jgi:Raf kinase inhibitor-like YbhB/YbcL family protein
MIDVSSRAIQPDAPIPPKYTCDGEGVSPPLEWSPPPIGTASVAILVDDPDAPSGPFVHWMIADIPPEVCHLEEGGVVPHDAFIGESDAGTASYYGPCPPSGVHHYRFHVYALDTPIGRRPRDREDFLEAIQGHVLDEGELVATYQRPGN